MRDDKERNSPLRDDGTLRLQRNAPVDIFATSASRRFAMPFDFTMLRSAAISYLLAGLLLVGCTPPEFPAPDDRLARETLADLQHRDLEAVRSHIDSAVASPNGPMSPALSMLADSIAGYTAADSATRVGYNVFTVAGAPDRRRMGVTYELSGHGRWLLATVEMSGTGDAERIIGLRIVPRTQSLASESAFTFRGKGPAHFLVLLMAIVCAGGSLVTAVVVARTRMPRRWLWAFVALVGAMVVQFDWSSGASRVLLFQVVLLSAGFAKAGPFAPWIVSFAMPVGAVLALDRRRRALRVPPPVVVPPFPPLAPLRPVLPADTTTPTT